MAYHPPADANELSDFLPPEGILIEAPPLTITLPVTPTMPLTTTLPALSSAITVTDPITQLVSFAAGQVAIVFEENSFAEEAIIQFATILTPTLVLTATNTLSNLIDSLILQRFQLEVYQEGEIVSADFAKPVRLIVDLRDVMAQLAPSYKTWRYFLTYQDENDPDVWIEVPIDVYQPDGLLSAEVMHFSNWAAGVRPERWNPSWTPPTVSSFSGAVTYNYPIEVPPGRRGLQPGISLSYSSRALDGRIRDGESGPIGDGWSLGGISVVRVGVKMEFHSGYPSTLHPDKFRLVFNGSGHELFPAAGANTTSDATVRYYVKDAPGYYLERNYSASGVPNTDGIYWILITPDGTRYRLGYYADAEEWQQVSHGSHLIVQGHPGRANLDSAIAWHLDTVTDSFGNQMSYHYHTWNTVENIEWYNVNHWTSFTLTTRKNRINDIKYNYPTRITSLPAAKTVERLTSTPATRIEFRTSGYHQNLITHIYLYHGGSASPISEYRIAAAGMYVSSPGCINYDTQPNTPRPSHTRIVNSIQRFVGTDSDPATNDNGLARLPATTFSHEYKRHFTKDSAACFQFYYMTGYQNGYGGTVSFTYVNDNRQVGEYYYIQYNLYSWPTIGYNYSVSEVRINDGRNPNVRTTYAYTQPCYAQLGSVPSGAVNCAEPNSPDEYGNLAGYQTATQTSYDYTNAVINRQITTFSQNANNSIGRPTQVQLKNSSNTLLTQTDHTYEPLTINGLANMFTYLKETRNYRYDGNNTLSSKTTYEYNPAYQGGSQYGNLTHIREFDNAAASAPIRTTVRGYYPNVGLTYGLLTGHWAVGYAGAEAIYSGDMATLLNGTWNYYDNESNHATPPTQGKLMRSRAYMPADCGFVCPYAYTFQTIDATFTYDPTGFGNQVSSTTYSGYGQRAFDANWTQVSNQFASTDPRTTTIAYESTYNLYPISVTNPLSQVTNFYIYGFNGVALDGFQKQPGLLKQVTGPDSVTTKYEYDPFGRLHAVYDGYLSYGTTTFAGFGDTDPWNGDPLTLYRYWDNAWNNSTTFLNPAGNAPFLIATQQRPGSFPAPANAGSGFAFNDQTFYDGFGRPIQTRSIWRWVEGQSRSREIISHTDYHANGQVSCQSVPYDIPFYSDQPKTWPASPFYTTGNCANKPNTTTTYDALGRPLVVTAPDGTSTAYSYFILNTLTVDGRSALALTNIRDANNQIVGQMTNSLGQLAMVQENAGAGTTPYSRTRYYYDPLGNLKEVRTTDGAVNGDPNPTGPETLRRVVMGYDNFGRKISMNDPDMGNWSYVYDAAGNLKEQRDANLARLCFEYDALDRLTHKRHDSNNNGCDGSDVQLAYYAYFSSGTGKVGKPSEIRWSSSSPQNRETFNYDSLGRLITHNRWVDSRQYTMSYGSFDALHRPTAITYPNSEVVTLTYDREGENSLKAGSDWLVTDIRYNARGQMTYLDRHNVADTTYLYHPQNDASGGGLGDSNFRLKTIQHGGAGTGDTWPDFTYEYDRVGNITKLTTTSTAGTDTQSFGYDHLNRLLTAVATGGVANYTHNTASTDFEYDRLGNITYFGNTTLYNYATRHSSCGSQPVHAQPQAVKQIGGNYYCYDNNGNMTRRVEGGVTYTQNFNVENELTSVVVSGQTTSFTYDAAGIRVKTVKPNGVVIDHPFPSYEVENPTATPIWRSTYSIASHPIATRVSDDPVSGNNGISYFYNDHLGSNTALRQPDGSRVSTYYLPFGNYRGAAPNQTITDRDFTGQPQNRAVGLLYYQARFYVPGVGRFASADTIIPNELDPQSWNRYTYVTNSPINFSDPSGHCIGQLPCPRVIKEAVDIVTGYDGCLDNPRACADYVIEDITNGFLGISPLVEGDKPREHAYPDYVTLQASFLIISGSLTMDTYSNIYGSVGLTVGAETTYLAGASVRLSAGYIVSDQYPRGYGSKPNQMYGLRPDIAPTEGELEALNRGLSVGGGAGFVLGADISVPLNNSKENPIGFEPGIYSPQLSVGVNYGFFLYDAH